MPCRALPPGRRYRRRGAGALLLLLAIGAGTASAQEPGTTEKPLLRLEYFARQRAYPYARIPPGALQRAQQQARARWPAEILRRPLSRLASADAERWLPLGPAPLANRDAGRISTIAIHPTNPARIYIGAAQGGVWRTDDGGASWTALTDGECSLAMGSLALDPVNPQIIYAGTGELHFSGDSYYGCGVLRSTDGGASWTQLGASLFDTNTGGARISKVLVDPATAGSASATTVLVASNFGIFRSTDSGNGWTLVLPGIATDMVMNPADPRTVYAAVGSITANSGNGVFRSTDGGSTWARLAGGFPTADVGRISLAIAPSAPAVLFAAVQNAFETPRAAGDGRLLGIWKSVDAGATWAQQQAVNASCGTQCWYDLVLAVHPTDADRVYFGGVLLYRSANGGASFTNVVSGTHVDQHAITFHPSNPAIMYVGNDGGIYRSANGGTSWTSINGNLEITQFYAGVSLHPSNAQAALGGTQDNGTVEFTGAAEWPQVLGGDGGFTAIDFHDPSIAYAETQWTSNSSFSGPRRREGPGNFDQLKVSGIDLADRALFIPPLVMEAVDPRVLYFGTFRLYRTADRGEQWSAISGELSRTPNGSVSAIAPAAADPRTVYVGTSDGHLMVTTDAGVTWVLRNSGLPDRYVTDVAVDARNAQVAIATVSGFGTGHVLRTVNGGASWQNISGNLPDVPVNAALTSPALGEVIYIGTDLGVFRSFDAGATWTPFNDNLPNVAVFDLAYSATSGLLVAATHGRGVFGFTPVRAALLVIAQDSISFTALGDTARLTATAVDAQGQPIGGVNAAWSTRDARVATVDAAGLVRAVGNGSTHIIAALGASADTAEVRVQQVVAAVTGLPDTASLVVGETRQLEALAVDRNGSAVAGEPLAWTSTDTAVVNVDASGAARATGPGTGTVAASSGAHRDTLRVRVSLPAVVVLQATPAAATARVTSAAGSRLALLRLEFSVDGVEPVRVTQVGFDVQGDDAGASLVLIRDNDDDGRIGPGDAEIGSAPAALMPGQPSRVPIAPASLDVAPGQTLSLLVAIRMSGAAPNNAAFAASFNPDDTRSVGLRSSAANRISQPATPVASALVRSTLLGDGQRFSMSANPVRTGAVTFNFAARPTIATVYTLSGRHVVDLLSRMQDDASVRWNLTNTNGAAVGPGVYLVVVEIEGQLIRERLIVVRSAQASARSRSR